MTNDWTVSEMCRVLEASPHNQPVRQTGATPNGGPVPEVSFPGRAWLRPAQV